MSSSELRGKFVIIGGGIAGVSCAEGLAFLAPEESTLLITASNLIKAVTNIVPLGTTLTKFDVEERPSEKLAESHPSVKVLEDTVIKVNPREKSVETASGKTIYYEKLCICTGARPRLIFDNSHVIGIRDTESVANLSSRLAKARKIIVVGNGGIATEIVHEIEDVEVTWVIKDKHISATFVDPGAAEFFQDKLLKKGDKAEDTEETGKTKRIKYKIVDGKIGRGGPALGPDWHETFSIRGNSVAPTKINIEYECEISEIFEPSQVSNKIAGEDWPVYASLTNGKILGCDFIVSATGVSPNTDLPGLENLEKSQDSGFSVDWRLQTSEKDIYAAGDACTANWELAEHWFQMRLWTQAHQMGRYAAKSIFSSAYDEVFHQDFCFELFTHVTKFFGYKIVLLGLFNGQKLNGNYEILLRMTKNREYIKLVMKDGKMQGAVLIGDTDLDEMCENLILNQLDLSIYGKDLLDPDIDIDDYFD